MERCLGACHPVKLKSFIKHLFSFRVSPSPQAMKKYIFSIVLWIHWLQPLPVIQLPYSMGWVRSLWRKRRNINCALCIKISYSNGLGLRSNWRLPLKMGEVWRCLYDSFDCWFITAIFELFSYRSSETALFRTLLKGLMTKLCNVEPPKHNTLLVI